MREAFAHLSDDEITDGWLGCQLGGTGIAHLDHVRIAWVLVRRLGREDGTATLVEGTRRACSHYRVPERFDAELTRRWAAAVADAHERYAPTTFGELLASVPELARSDLLGRPSWLASTAAVVGVDEEVLLIDYDERWPLAFRREEERLRAALDSPFRIDHIGSTAVPGCRSKPIVDIQIVVPQEDMERVVEVAVSLGYTSFADERIPQRIYLRLRRGDDSFNLQVIDAATELAEDNVALREYLRGDAHARELYERAKAAAAASAPRLRGYSETKAATVQKLIEVARRQAP